MKQLLTNQIKRVLPIAGVALLAVGVSSCGEHPLYANGLGLQMQPSPENSVLPAIGQTLQLTVTARDAVGRAANPPLLVWETSNPEIATVDQNGRVTAVRDGIVAITVQAGDAGVAATRIYVKSTVRSAAWISAVANPDRRVDNNSDSSSVVLHHRVAR